MDRQYQPMTTAPTYHQDEQHHQLHQLHHHHQQPSPAQLLPPYPTPSPPLLLLQARHHLPPLQLELQQQQNQDPAPVLPVLSSVFPQLAPLNHRRTAVVQTARSRSDSGSRSRSRSPWQPNTTVVKREGDRSVAPYPSFANHSHSHGHSHSHSHLPSPVPAAATAAGAATTVIPGLALLDETDNDVKPAVTKLEEPGRDRDEKSASRKYGLSTPPEDNMTGAGGGGVPGAVLGHTQYTYVGGIGAGQYAHGSLNGTTTNGNANANGNVQGLGHGFGAAAAGFVKQENSDVNAPARLQTQRRQNQQQPQLQPQSRHWKLSHLTSEVSERACAALRELR
ncbi:hypothetical protein KEM55_008245 [Ascosphaera atra]|nr:hypothetical protein KEM55_008245 [Ascosphaera atra]